MAEAIRLRTAVTRGKQASPSLVSVQSGSPGWDLCSFKMRKVWH